MFSAVNHAEKALTTEAEQTNYVAGTISSADGEYRFELLPPGTYSLMIQAPGFAKSVFTGVVLREDQTQRIDATLQVATVEAVVDIQAGEAQVEQFVTGAVAPASARGSID